MSNPNFMRSKHQNRFRVLYLPLHYESIESDKRRFPEKKKCILPSIARITPLTPPPCPQFGQLVQLFSDVKIQELKVSLGLEILYIIYRVLFLTVPLKFQY